MEATATDLLRFGAAIAMGALVGIEREFSGTPAAKATGAAGEAPDGAPAAAEEADDDPDWAAVHGHRPFRRPAGVRTHSLVALLGAVTAYSASTAPWLLPVVLLCVGLLVLASYVLTFQRYEKLGVTSEVTVLLVLLLGALCARGDIVLAGACAVVATTLLSLKPRTRRLTLALRREDLYAVLKFAVLTMVILPLLPPETIRFGERLPGAAEGAWWGELSFAPRKVWYFVVVISGVSFAGYALGKLVGPGRGIVLTGAFGGLVSSTAVSLAFSQRSSERPELSRQFAVGILLANAIMPVRLTILVVVVAPALLGQLALPMLLMLVAAGVATAVLYARGAPDGERSDLSLKNPFEIGPALKFGAIFAVVLLVAQAAQALFGRAGLLAASTVAGLTDVDAIGLAVADMVERGQVEAFYGAVAIVLATIANTVVKAGFVVWFGAGPLKRLAGLAFGAMLVAGLAGLGLLRALAG